MRKIAAVEDFFTPELKATIVKAAQDNGFSVDFYTSREFTAEMSEPYEIIYGSLTAKKLSGCKNIKWYACSFAGVDSFLQWDCFPNEDMLFTNSAGAYGVTIAEHIIMVTLMMMRHARLFGGPVSAEKWMKSPPMHSITGSRITVLGVGDIGTNFARRAKGMGAAHITGVRRTMQPADESFDEILTFADLDKVLPTTDVLVMAMPKTPQTDNMLSRERIALLPETAYVVNVGRGNAIDQEALMEALNADRLAGAALDVMVPEPLPADHPLWTTKNAFITPHISGQLTLGITCQKDVDLFCQDLYNYTAGRPLQQAVDKKLGY